MTHDADARLDPLDLSLLDRYLAGTATPDERGAVLAMVEGDRRMAAVVETLRAVGEKTVERDVDAAWVKDWARIREYSKTDQHPQKLSNRKESRWLRHRPVGSRVKMLSGAFLAALSAAVVWIGMDHSLQEESSQPMVYTTRAAQHATVTLSDGSTVLLGDATTLTVPRDFGRHHRFVTLTGQAHFTVPHSAGAPFIVRAKASEARVLGTTFTVRAYGDDGDVRVMVSRGKIALHGVARSVVLTDHMIGVAVDSGEVKAIGNADVSRELRWTTGQLVFEEVRVAVAMRDIERRYGITINFTDSTLTSRLLTTTIANETLSEMLDLLALTLRAEYRRSGVAGRTVTFTPSSRVLRRAPTRSILAPETQYGR
jgi:transmembrane sensor